MQTETAAMRPVIVKAVVVCLTVAAAPWLSGGQLPLGRLVSAFALLLGLLLMWRQPKAPVLRRGPLLWTYGALMALAALSLLWTANRYSSALWISEWVMAAIAFKLALGISADKVGRKWLMGAYLVAVALFSVSAIWMYVTGQYGRLTGTFYWANPAAAYLVPAIVWAIDRMRRLAGRRQLAWTAAAGGLLGTFMLADSRAAGAVLALIIVLYLALAKLSKRFWIHFLFAVALAVAMSYGLVKISSFWSDHSNKVVPGSRLNEAIKGESSSGSDRQYYLMSALDMWRDRPWGGVGAGAYGDVHPQYQRRVVSASANAHNVYAQTLAELGIGGALLLMAVLGMLFIGVLRGLFDRPELLAAALGILGLLLHFGLDIDASYPALLMLVGILSGMIYTEESLKWVKQPVWTVLLGVLVLIPAVSGYMSASLADRALAAEDDGDYASAADYYSQADHLPVFNPDYVNAEGISLYALGASGGPDAKANLNSALDRARRGQRLDPHDAQNYQLEGRILVQLHDGPGALKAFQRALELDRYNHPDYAFDLASLQAAMGQKPAALKTISDMLAQYPASVRNNRAADESLKFELKKLQALQKNLL